MVDRNPLRKPKKASPIGRESPAQKKRKMLEHAATWLQGWGYDFINIVWKWQSRSHDIEAYKDGLLYRFYVFRAAFNGRYWMSQIGGKDICQIRTWPRVKAIFSVPGKGFYAISHREFKKQCNKATYNLSLGLNLSSESYYPRSKLNARRNPEMLTYLGQCDYLRRVSPENEAHWQSMMQQKMPIDVDTFQENCDLSSLLDPDESDHDYLEEAIASDPESGFYSSYWGEKPCLFLQTCGFEFIFAKDGNYRRNIDLTFQPPEPPALFKALLAAGKRNAMANSIDQKLLVKLTTMPSRLLKMNRFMARQLFSLKWDLDVNLCPDHIHTLVIYFFKEQPRTIDVITENLLDDITKTTKAIVSETLNKSVEIVETRIDHDDEEYVFIVEMLSNIEDS